MSSMYQRQGERHQKLQKKGAKVCCGVKRKNCLHFLFFWVFFVFLLLSLPRCVYLHKNGVLLFYWFFCWFSWVFCIGSCWDWRKFYVIVKRKNVERRKYLQNHKKDLYIIYVHSRVLKKVFSSRILEYADKYVEFLEWSFFTIFTIFSLLSVFSLFLYGF